MSKYLQRNVFDQLYKLSVRPQLDYCDVIYCKHDRLLSLNSLKGYNIRLPWQSVELGRGQTWIDCTKNWAGNPCIIRGGKDL